MLHQCRLPAWHLLLCALLSAGCSAGPPQVAVRVERVAVPPGLLSCDPEPPIPAALRSDADLAAWIVSLAAAGEDCRARLGRVRELVSRPDPS